MSQSGTLIMAFQQARSASIAIWNDLSEEIIFSADILRDRTVIRQIRDVLASELWHYHCILRRGFSHVHDNPLSNNPFISVDQELTQAQPYREKFLQMVHKFTEKDLEEIVIFHPVSRKKMSLEQYLFSIVNDEIFAAGCLKGSVETWRITNVRKAS